MNAERRSHRIALLGDPHIAKEDRFIWREIIDDINALRTDAVFLLGDLTDHGDARSLAAVVELFHRFAAPWYTVIGNHDLKAKEHDTDEKAVSCFLRHIEKPTPWFSVPVGPIMVLGLSNTCCRDNPFTPNEIVLDPEQVAWCNRQLAEDPTRPAVVICHTPPMGSDLMTLPEFHGIGGSAYVNQQHRPGDIQQLIRDNPNILLWCSSHSHLGQHYADAIQQRLVVHYVHVGMASRRKSRDGRRHSRIIDFNAQRFTIRTFDHVTHQFDDAMDYTPLLSMDALIAQRTWARSKRVPPRPTSKLDNRTASDNRCDIIRFGFINLNALLAADKVQQEKLVDWCREQCWEYAVDEIVVSQVSGVTADAAWLSQLYVDDFPMSYIGPKGAIQAQISWDDVPIRCVKGQMSSMTSPNEPILLWKADNPTDFLDVRLPDGQKRYLLVFANVCPPHAEIIDQESVTLHWIWPVNTDIPEPRSSLPIQAGTKSGIQQYPISCVLTIIDWNTKQKIIRFPGDGM